MANTKFKKMDGHFVEGDYENTLISLLEHEGWQYIPGGEIPRENLREVVYTDDLLTFLKDACPTLDNDDILELASLTGPSAVVDIDYVRGSGTAYSGTGIITGYTETNPADPEEDPTYGLTVESEDME